MNSTLTSLKPSRAQSLTRAIAQNKLKSVEMLLPSTRANLCLTHVMEMVSNVVHPTDNVETLNSTVVELSCVLVSQDSLVITLSTPMVS